LEIITRLMIPRGELTPARPSGCGGAGKRGGIRGGCDVSPHLHSRAPSCGRDIGPQACAQRELWAHPWFLRIRNKSN
jgi:hypothetical protein